MRVSVFVLHKSLRREQLVGEIKLRDFQLLQNNENDSCIASSLFQVISPFNNLNEEENVHGR